VINGSTKKMTNTLLLNTNKHPTIDPKTPARRNYNSRTSELKDLSEGKNTEKPFQMTSQEILESDKKSHTPGPGYPSIKKDLRNKSNKIGQVSNARRFNDGRVDQAKFTAAIRQSEAVGK